MNIRRTLLRGLAACLAFALAGPALSAQEAWPSKPIRLIVAWPAGSPPDTFARVYAERLAKTLKVPVVVDNKAGAGGNIGSDTVAKAAPDGYTFLYTVSNAFTLNPLVYRKLPFNADKDLTPVAPILSQGAFVVVTNGLPVSSINELMAYAKQNPAKLSYASYGVGTIGHLAVELLKDTAGVHMLHIPYKVSPMTDLIAGQVQVSVEPAGSVIPMIKTGKVRAIAFGGLKRHAQFPNVPTVGETYPGIAVFGWHGLWAPAGVPHDIVMRMNTEVTRITLSPDVASQVAELGSESFPGTPEAMTAMVMRERKAFADVIRSRNISLD